MSMIKKSISLSLVTAICVGMTGCANGVNPVPKESPQEISNIENRIKFVNENQKDYEEIKIGKHVHKKDSLNKKGLPDFKTKVAFTENRKMYLKDVSSMIGFPILVEKSIEMNEIKFNGEIEGSFVDVLNFVGGIAGVYWTYENGVVRFVKQKDIIYNFPAFSIAKMNNIYNVGETDGNPFKIDDVKEDVFDEIKLTISNVLDNVVFSGDVTETYSYQSDNSNEKIKNNISKSNLSNSDKNNNTENNSIKEDNRIENTNSSQQDLEKNNNKNYDYSLGKESSGNKGGNSKGATPTKTVMGLEPIINNRTNFVDVNKDITNAVDREIKSSAETNSNNSIKENTNLNIKDNSNELSNRNSDKNIVNETNSVSYNTKIQGNLSRVSISKESGIIYVTVSPKEEQKIDNILNEVTKNMLGSLINLDLFILEVEEEKLAEFNQNFDGVFSSGIISKSFSLSQSAGLGLGYDSATTGNALISEDLKGVLNSSKNLNFLLSYLTGDSRGEILSQPKILSLPNTPARMKDGVFIPYLKPGEITSDTTNITYQVENVNSGIDLGVTSAVLGDHLVVSLGIRINEYLGDKTISAGTLGEYTLPMQAPKVLNSTFRVSPGDIIILGGSNKTSNKSDNFENLFLPTNFKNSLTKKKFIIIAMPKLVRFVEDNEEK